MEDVWLMKCLLLKAIGIIHRKLRELLLSCCRMVHEQIWSLQSFWRISNEQVLH